MENMIPAIISVRAESSRLPRKCFLPFGTCSVLEHVVHRAKLYQLSPIICTTNETADDEIVRLAEKLKIPYFRGSTVNKLKRWSDCCQALELEVFHSVDADDPFFCGSEVKRSMGLLGDTYDVVAPNTASSQGGATVGYSIRASAIEMVCAKVTDDTDTEMMWGFLDIVPGLKKVVLCDPDEGVIKARMTLDYQEDYILLEAIRLILGSNATRKQIAKLFLDNPNLLEINAFRSKQWSDNQQKKLQASREEYYE